MAARRFFLVIVLVVLIKCDVVASRKSIVVEKCPNDWKTFGNKCYRVYTAESDNIISSFNNSGNYCGEKGGTLVSIDSQKQQDFLITYLRELNVNSTVWIGLYNLNQTTKDDNILNFTEISPKQMKEVLERQCFLLTYTKNIPRIYKNHRCDEPNGFICQITLVFNNLTCPSNWINENQSKHCYYIETGQKDTFDSANQRCSLMAPNATLVTFRSVGEIDVLKQYFLKYEGLKFLVGLKAGIFGDFRYVDSDEEASFLPWDIWQPQFTLSRKCVEIDTRTMKYQNFDCDTSEWYICQVAKAASNQPVPVVPIRNGLCPQNWINQNESDYCYYIESDRGYIFDGANEKCNHLAPKGSLATFRSESEINLLEPYLTEFEGMEFMVGIKEGSFGDFMYLDSNEKVKYLPWEEWQPRFTLSHKCVLIAVQTMKYRNFDCSESKGFICQAPKEVLKCIPKHLKADMEEYWSNQHLPLCEDEISMSQTLEIVFPVTIVIIVAAVVAYLVYRKRMMSNNHDMMRLENEGVNAF